MRIIGGARRGLKLAEVGAGDAAAHLRPTPDRVREAIFNLLLNGGYGNLVADSRVLDLFAGTGALGLEALSRGAQHATFVENGKVALDLLRRNIDLMQATDQTRILRVDATSLAANPGPGFDLLFLDPPYGQSRGEIALSACLSGNWLTQDAMIIWEENRPPIPPAGLQLMDQRKYGETIITLLRPGP